MGTTFAETEADALYRRAGFATTDAPGLLVLARCILGADGVSTHTGLSSPGRFLPRQREIWLRPGLPPEKLTYVLAHELAEMDLHELDYREPDREQVADAIAAALVCPRTAFRGAVRAIGFDLPQLAEAFVTTQSVVALRLGETTGTPVALVTERHVHARGEPYAWGEVRELRAIARGKVVVPGLERRELTDAPRRVMLRAA